MSRLAVFGLIFSTYLLVFAQVQDDDISTDQILALFTDLFPDYNSTYDTLTDYYNTSDIETTYNNDNLEKNDNSIIVRNISNPERDLDKIESKENEKTNNYNIEQLDYTKEISADLNKNIKNVSENKTVTKSTDVNGQNNYQIVNNPSINVTVNDSTVTSDDMNSNNFKSILKEEVISDAHLKKIEDFSRMFGYTGPVESIPSDYLDVLKNLVPADSRSSQLSKHKHYDVKMDIDSHSFLNSSETSESENRENYGISVVLSGDIMALAEVVEKIEDSVCKNQSLLLLQSLLTGKLWALKMYDASAKSPTGLLWGNTFQLGNFDECLESRSSDDSNAIKGQYCLANVELLKRTLPTTNYGKRYGPREDIHWAVCVPDSCPASLVQEFVTSLLISASGGGKVSLPPANCHKEKPLKLDKNDVIFASVIIGFSAILVFCTLYHLYIHFKKKKSQRRHTTVLESAILSFSVARNLRKIFSVKKHSELGLDAIAGIRTMTMLFILAGHALMFIFSGPVMNTGFYDKMLAKAENTLILSNPLLVDTFLLISAFLFCRLLLLELDKRKGKVNVIPIYIFRYLRVTPSYFVVIGLYMTWLDKLSQGPLWNSKMALEKERCLESWWTNILYINNYVNTENLCMFQSWYLSVDTQLFFLAPAIIYPLWRWRRIGEWMLGILTAICVFVPFLVTYLYRLDPTILPFPKEMTDITKNFYFKEAYIKTHMRASAYCIGLVSGYILHRIQTTGFKFNRRTLIVAWILAIVCGSSSVFSVTIFFQPEYQYNAVASAAYSALHRIAWAAANGWLLIACSTKNGGPFEKLFMWKPLIPLGRLTYCAYLVNGLVELHSLGTLRDSIHLSIYNLMVICLSHALQTFVGALILCVMFESPIHGFEKILLNAIGNKLKNETRESKENLENTQK